MASQTISNPLQVYLETTVIVDLCWQEEERHANAQKLLDVFEKYISPEKQIQVFVSRWARMEAHSKIYEKLLKAKEGIEWDVEYRSQKGRKKAKHAPRDVFPPMKEWLKEATVLVDGTFEDLRSRSVLHVKSPEPGIWEMAIRLAEEAAIYPLDSIHVATAIHWGCSLFIATDRDLLDKVTLHDDTIQQLFKESLHLESGREFEVVPLQGLNRMYKPKTLGDALIWLKQHGFD